MAYLKKFFQWMFLIGFIGMCTSAFSVVSPPRSIPGEEDYNRCVAGLTSGAVSSSVDGDNWLINNLDQAIRDQCEKMLTRFTSLYDSLKESDLAILFGQDPLRSENKIQAVEEWFTFSSIPLGEDLCQKTADNIFSDDDNGFDRSTFFIKTEGDLYNLRYLFSISVGWSSHTHITLLVSPAAPDGGEGSIP